MSARLGSNFFSQETRDVARQLLGKRLVRMAPNGRRLSGIVVEVEAYLSHRDLASHSHRGQSQRNASMFLESGRLYVYSIHAKYCLNVVTEPLNHGAAILIRALEPDEGLPTMIEHRGLHFANGVPIDIERKAAISLTSGPARLCQALAIDRTHDGLDLLCDERLWLEDAPHFPIPRGSIRRGPRIGISQSQQLPLRWFLDGHYFVSGLSRAHSSSRRSWSYFSWR